jgi:hypothetical protein
MLVAGDLPPSRGDIRVLGASACAAPLISTALLIRAGYAAPAWSIAVAAALIAGGAMLASKEVFGPG